MLASRRGLHVIGVAAMVVAAVGFFSGIADERKDVHSGEGEEVVATAPVPGYADLRIVRRGPNAAIYAGAFERFAARVPGVLAQVPPQTDAPRSWPTAVKGERTTARLRPFRTRLTARAPSSASLATHQAVSSLDAEHPR